MKKAGIVCDNYKVPRFEKALTEHGFADYSKKPSTTKTTGIFIYCKEERIPDIGKICATLEIEFKQSN